MSKAYRITLGMGWKRFVRPPLADLELLGIIACGAQVGALGMRAGHSFIQLNGDRVTPLKARRVLHVLGGCLPQVMFPHRQVSPVAAVPVQVTVRKRRTMVIPMAGATSQMSAA
jgi:hypothetical protein